MKSGTVETPIQHEKSARILQVQRGPVNDGTSVGLMRLDWTINADGRTYRSHDH